MGFNPRPPRRAGATTKYAPDFRHLLVSILARPEGRALHAVNKLYVDTVASFNPRPPRRAGATKDTPSTEEAYVVSILARPEGRALQ